MPSQACSQNQNPLMGLGAARAEVRVIAAAQIARGVTWAEVRLAEATAQATAETLGVVMAAEALGVIVAATPTTSTPMTPLHGPMA